MNRNNQYEERETVNTYTHKHPLKDNKLQVLELFAGIGACSKALENLNIQYKIVDAVEINKYAVASFNAIHNTNFETQDIRDWNKDVKVDLIMHGSPCQDFSIAGKQAGGDKDSDTRSSLMYETIRIVEKLRPQYVLWENVKNILSQRHKHNFDSYIENMNELGYNSYYQVLNAKDYGVPQNRERVYTVSIRKDIDNNTFKFPEKEELKMRLKDILEEEVEEKYYLSQKMIDGFMEHNRKHKEKNTGFIWKPKTKKDIASTLRANGALCPTDNTINVGEVTKNSQAGQVYSTEGISPTITAGTHGYAMGNIMQVEELDIKGQDNIKRVYALEGISPTLTNMQEGNRQPKIIVKNATKQGYAEAFEGDSINLAYPNSKTRRGRVGKQVSQTLQCSESMGVVTQEIRIRKLTPKECWRLMSFSDEDFQKAANINSNTQLYKQAGNSIVVDVLEKILEKLLLK